MDETHCQCYDKDNESNRLLDRLHKTKDRTRCPEITGGIVMRKKFSARAAALGMSGVLLTSALTGCTFGFASDPDDPNAVKEEVPIDMTTDTFQYDTSLSGTSIVIMNTKAEIQTALEKIANVFE